MKTRPENGPVRLEGDTELRRALAESATWVVKVGSALITDAGEGLNLDRIADWCRQIGVLMASGKRVVVVSSGAVAEGCRRLGFRERPGTVHDLKPTNAAFAKSGATPRWCC